MKHFNHMEYTETLMATHNNYHNKLTKYVCQSQSVVNHGSFVPAQYSLTDSINKHFQENNYLLHDL